VAPTEEAEEAAARLRAIRTRIAAACRRAGRDVGEVVLVGASKGQPVALLAAFVRAGLTVFGENRVQEALAKRRALPAGVDWHLIGPLQSNKVRAALELFGTVHSIDRVKIAEALDREAGRLGVALAGLLEVNLGLEQSKHGFAPRGLAAAVRPLAALEHLRIVGLMAIPPAAPVAPIAPLATIGEHSRPWFRRLRELRDELRGRTEWAGFPGWLSMGMSDDFEIAIEEGATHVRVGTALFGPRPPLPMLR
jgi:PLP dependent protein